MKYLPMFFIYGLIFGAGPCLVSCGTLLLSYLGIGTKGIRENIAAYFLFTLARLAVYIILGLLVFLLGSFWAERHLENFLPSISAIGGILVVIVGIFSLLGKIRSCEKFCSFKGNVVFLGFLAGLLPCAPLLAVLSYMGLLAKSWGMSVLYSLSFGAGTILSPLLALVIFAGLVPRVLKERRFLKAINILCSLVLIVIGIHLIIKGF